MFFKKEFYPYYNLIKTFKNKAFIKKELIVFYGFIFVFSLCNIFSLQANQYYQDEIDAMVMLMEKFQKNKNYSEKNISLIYDIVKKIEPCKVFINVKTKNKKLYIGTFEVNPCEKKINQKGIE